MLLKRHRRFPLMSLLVVLALAAGMIRLTYLNVDTPQQALSKVGEAVTALGRSLSLIGRGKDGDTGFSGSDGSTGGGGFGLFKPTRITPGTDDTGMPMLVNLDHPVPEGYTMENPVTLASYCDPNIVAIKSADIQGERVVVDALQEMLAAAIEQGVSEWQISAGYRTAEAQQQMWNDKVQEYLGQGLSEDQAQRATAGYVALAGHSEHETGLTFDVTVPGQSFPLTPQCQWLSENCWDYGFIIRYTEAKQSITKINAEPWHIRYVGQVHAQRMRDADQCLEEYVGAI